MRERERVSLNRRKQSQRGKKLIMKSSGFIQASLLLFQICILVILSTFEVIQECNAFIVTGSTKTLAMSHKDQGLLLSRGSASPRMLMTKQEASESPLCDTSYASSAPFFFSRRELCSSLVTVTTAITVGIGAVPPPSNAIEGVMSTEVEMKNFIDPVGLFTIRVPQNFYTLRRSAKGDLPDEKTGSGRRGSSIFTSGNMAKAEVVAVERFPTKVLLEENGVEATGDLSTISGLGEPAAVAMLINLRREKDKPGGASNTRLVPESIIVSPDQKELQFTLKTEIDVQKPELLLEQYGISRLFRITVAKVSLRSNDGNMMGVFASALEQDFNGPDGVALLETVKSFQVADRSRLMEKK